MWFLFSICWNWEILFFSVVGWKTNLSFLTCRKLLKLSFIYYYLRFMYEKIDNWPCLILAIKSSYYVEYSCVFLTGDLPLPTRLAGAWFRPFCVNNSGFVFGDLLRVFVFCFILEFLCTLSSVFFDLWQWICNKRGCFVKIKISFIVFHGWKSWCL